MTTELDRSFQERLERIDAMRRSGWWKRGPTPRQRRRPNPVMRLPMRLIVMTVLLVLGLKTMLLATAGPVEYAAALNRLPRDTHGGAILRVVFGPDPISRAIARHLRL